MDKNRKKYRIIMKKLKTFESFEEDDEYFVPRISKEHLDNIFYEYQFYIDCIIIIMIV